MESFDVEKLLEKYFEGKTTVSEEKQLRTYFAQEEIPFGLEKYKDLFSYFSKESTLKTTQNIKLSNRKKSWHAWLGIAASIALIVGVFLTKSTVPEPKDTFEDPKVALEETKKILDMVSFYMNSGKQDLVYLNKFENTKSKFIK